MTNAGVSDIERYKFIRDTIHGNIRVDSLLLDLLETPEVQRLSGIRQLGLSYLVFPGANHTRFEHSLGTCHVAREIANSIGLSADDCTAASAVALLHDVGHGPFSHTLESLYHGMIGSDHAEITQDIISGNYDIIQLPEPDKTNDAVTAECRERIPDVLRKHGLDPDAVASMVTGTAEQPLLDFFGGKKIPPKYPAHIIHSALDADQIDYILRDGYYTGVAYGTVDLDRLLQTMAVCNGKIVFTEKGVSAVESILVARALMYSSVYLHKTVRIAELMLARAVEKFIEDNPNESGTVWRMNDGELMARLGRAGMYERMIYRRLRHRQLFKKAYSLDMDSADDDIKKYLARLARPEKRRRKETEICSRAGIPEGSVIIDIPAPELLLSEPRLQKVDVKILGKDGRLRPFSQHSTLADALRIRTTVKWAVMVSAVPEHRDRVMKIAQKTIFG